MRQQSKQSQDMNSKSRQSYLIVDYPSQTFSMLTKEQYETMKAAYTSIRLLTSRTKKPFSETSVFSLPHMGVEFLSLTTSRGLQLDLLTTMNAKSLTESLRDSNFSRRNFDSGSLKSHMLTTMGKLGVPETSLRSPTLSFLLSETL